MNPQRCHGVEVTHEVPTAHLLIQMIGVEKFVSLTSLPTHNAVGGLKVSPSSAIFSKTILL